MMESLMEVFPHLTKKKNSGHDRGQGRRIESQEGQTEGKGS